MPWHIGLDEAGYGPKLGPLIQAAIAVHSPSDEPAFWVRFSTVIRRANEPRDSRLLIDDSKRVHAGPHGFRKLEVSILAAGTLAWENPEYAQLWQRWLLEVSRHDLLAEPWFEPALALPRLAPPLEIEAHRVGLAEVSREAEFLWAPPRAVAVPTPRFNTLLDQYTLKSNVLACGVIQLLRESFTLPGSDALFIAVDKLGGRTFYEPLLQETFPQSWIHPVRESADECIYDLYGLGREVRISFRPRADGADLCVALASMLCKYLREVCMEMFNRYWCQFVPELKPTAGYPVDAARFMEEIRPILEAKGIAEDRIWRRK